MRQISIRTSAAAPQRLAALRRSAVLWAAVLVAIGSSAVASGQTLELNLERDEVEAYRKIEFRIGVRTEYANPFNPEEVDVSLQLTTPRGTRLTLPAFYYQAYERRRIPRGDQQVDWLYPSGEGEWRARFAASEPGVYTVVAVCRDAKSRQQSLSKRFRVLPGKQAGFVRVNRLDPRYLQLDNGTPLFLIGQNVAFIGSGQYAGLSKAEEIFGKLAASGANSVRVWACCEDWAIAIESPKSAWARSWTAAPPFVPMPDHQGPGPAPRCIAIGDRNTPQENRPVVVSPSHDLAVRPSTKYRLTGRLRVEEDLHVELSVPGQATVELPDAAGRWLPFTYEFTTEKNRYWIEQITFRGKGKGRGRLDALSLKEAAGSSELLWEADLNRPARGVYNLLDCFQLDAVMEAAEKHGLYVQVCLMARDLYAKSLEDPRSPAYHEAVRDARKLLRYAVARWGYSTQLAVWEYFNEMNPAVPADAFYADLGKFMEQVDVYRHLRTTSAWGDSPKDWRHQQLDAAQLHYYLRPEAHGEFRDETSAVLQRIRRFRKEVPNRPILLSEFGLAGDNWELSPRMKEDAELIHFHNALWASAFSEASGTVHFWWWEQLDRPETFAHYRALTSFLEGVPLAAEHLRPAAAACTADELTVLGRQDSQHVYLWIFHEEATWWNRIVRRRTPAEVEGAVVTVQGLAPGAYRVQWWDPWKGVVRKREAVSTSDGTLRLTIPAFSLDIALKLLP